MKVRTEEGGAEGEGGGNPMSCQWAERARGNAPACISASSQQWHLSVGHAAGPAAGRVGRGAHEWCNQAGRRRVGHARTDTGQCPDLFSKTSVHSVSSH